VAVDSAAVATVLGCHTFSAAEIDVAQLAEADRRRLPRHPVPRFRKGRLACRVEQRGRGLGELLVGCAVDRRLKARQQVAALALLVDAISETARRFHEHFGFRRLMDRDLTLYLPRGR